MKIYLSGPMTGIEGFNFSAFNKAAKDLRDKGYDVVNPAELNTVDMEWSECIRSDLKALCECDTIVLLPGWENSKGANLELHMAHRMGLKVNFIERMATGNDGTGKTVLDFDNAICFSLSLNDGYDAILFLDLWRRGCWSEITSGFPAFAEQYGLPS